VVVVVDLRQVGEIMGAELLLRAEEAAVARLGAEALEACGKRRLVLRLDRPDVDLAPAQRDRLAFGRGGIH
jgi:hypothetical protein